jgi:N-acyl amino acid synthase of PEP-CTERM/exosortase system
MYTRLKQSSTRNTGYEVVLADTEESKKIHFNLRYQIYCIEKGFEEAKRFPDELEKDEYDENAVHFLVRHRADNQWVGAFRLIIDQFQNLPIYQHANIDYAHQVEPTKTAVEFTRLAILRSFQKLPGKTMGDFFDPEFRLVFNAIAVGIEYSRKNGSQEIFFFCRPSLARIIKKMGLQCPQIGDKSLFRGLRYPYKFNLLDFPYQLFRTRQAYLEYHQNNWHIPYSETFDFESDQRVRAAA